MTIAVDRLEKRGLVERKGIKEDRRSRVVHLTDTGRKLIECAFEAHSTSMDRLAKVLTSSERRQLVGLLKKIGKQDMRPLLPPGDRN
jgi:DNA-binding MarR family transcriptional regulator